MAVVDYDMDEGDQTWLTQTNASHANLEGRTALSDEDFEILVNLCEKMSITAGRPVSLEEATGAVNTRMEAEKRPTLLEWLPQVYGYWESKLKRLRKPLLRWVPPQQPKGAQRRAPQQRQTAQAAAAAHRAAVAQQAGHRRGGMEGSRVSRTAPHGQFSPTEPSARVLPATDLRLLQSGVTAALPSMSHTTRTFEVPPDEKEEEAPAEEALGEGEVESAKMASLKKLLETERKARILAEAKVAAMATQEGSGVAAQGLKRRFDAHLDEYERAVHMIEAQLKQIEDEEAGLRAKYEDERRRSEMERKRHEQERRERMQRDREQEVQRKKLGRERSLLEKKLREHEVLKHMMESQLREGFHQWQLEQEITRNVAGLLGEVEEALQEDPAVAEKRVREEAKEEMRKLRVSLESDLNSWKDLFLSRYLRPVQRAIQDESPSKRQRINAPQPDSALEPSEARKLEQLANDTEDDEEPVDNAVAESTATVVKS